MPVEMILRSEWGEGIDLGRGWVGTEPLPLKPLGIVVHHTDEDEKFNSCDHAGCLARMRHWHIFHTTTRQFSDIGYHQIICAHGHLFEGRQGGIVNPIQGAHAVGNNDRALGIALLGNFQRQLPSYGALATLRKVLLEAKTLHAIQPGALMSWQYLNADGTFTAKEASTIVGHRDLRHTLCPGERLYNVISELRNVDPFRV